jgi:hypothetical protein
MHCRGEQLKAVALSLAAFLVVGEGLADPSSNSLDQDGPTPEAPMRPADTEESPELARAREYFRRGAQSVAHADWADALVAFEQSAALRPHPVTMFNIAVCRRAMGQYAQARLAFREALERSDRGEGALSEGLLHQARTFVSELDALLVRVRMRIIPPGARITVDGRPLLKTRLHERPTYLAGVRQPAMGDLAPAGEFEIIVEPGKHVFTVSQRGFRDVVVVRTLAPGTADSLELQLSRLPAVLRIESNRADAVVNVDSLDVGVVPVTLRRPAGQYEVLVRKPGFVDYQTSVVVKPGEHIELRADLPKVEAPITHRWWFWTAAGAVVAGAALTTYALTRPEPTRPPTDGGTLGWVVQVP